MSSNKIYLSVLLIFSLISTAIFSQAISRQSLPQDYVIIKAIYKDSFTRIPAPDFTTNQKQVNFNVVYNGFSAQAQTAFQYAVDIWASLLTSSITVKVIANWDSLGPGILGSASAGTFWRDFPNAPMSGTWYPTALAEKLRGAALNHADSSDIVANFNSNFNNWYFGTDGNCPAGQYDFVSVVLHELCHGLGFQGSMDINGGQGSWGFNSGYPFIYDRFTQNGSGQVLLNTVLFPNPSSALANQLKSNNIYFSGAKANAANGGFAVKLYAPASWNSGSSYSHLDESTFPAGNVHSLMTPALSSAEAIHHPGNIALGIFEDMGWTLDPAAGFDNTINDHLVNDFALFQNFPNPFNPETQIKYTIPEPAHVRLKIYNIQGKLIKIIVDEFKNIGTYTIKFGAPDLASGIYLYQLETDHHKITKKMYMIQ